MLYKLEFSHSSFIVIIIINFIEAIKSYKIVHLAILMHINNLKGYSNASFVIVIIINVIINFNQLDIIIIII